MSKFDLPIGEDTERIYLPLGNGKQKDSDLQLTCFVQFGYSLSCYLNYIELCL